MSKKMNRRVFLRSAFGGLLLLAGGSLWRMADQGVWSTGRGKAYTSWSLFGEENHDLPLKLVRSAILASNPHNTQPWLFRMGDGSIDLLADLDRNLGTMDPFLREMAIGLGCALENMALAADAAGLDAELELLPDGEWPKGSSSPRRVATLRWAETPRKPDDAKAQGTPLYEWIPRRHTDRGPYDPDRPLPDGLLAALRELEPDRSDVDVVWFEGEEERAEVGKLLIESTEAIAADREQSADSHVWFRHDWDEMQRLRDGITIDASGNPGLTRAMGKLLPDMSVEASNGYWLKATRETQVPTAAAFGMIVVRNERSRVQLLKAGRLWQRMHLYAVSRGAAMQPMNQPNERADREAKLGLEPAAGRALQRLAGHDGWQSVFVFRIGMPKSPALKSPRRLPEQVLL